MGSYNIKILKFQTQGGTDAVAQDRSLEFKAARRGGGRPHSFSSDGGRHPCCSVSRQAWRTGPVGLAGAPVLRAQAPALVATHIHPGARLRLALPALALLLFLCRGFPLIRQLGRLPFRLLGDWRGGLLLLLGRQGQRLEVVAAGLGRGVRVVEQQVVLLLVLDHLAVHADGPEPGPGQRSGVLVALRQVPRRHLLLGGDLEALW